MINKKEVLVKLEEIEVLLSDLEQKLEQSINTEKETIISNQIKTHKLLEGRIHNLENKMNEHNNIMRFKKSFEANSALKLKLQELV